MKYLALLILTFSCSSYRGPAHSHYSNGVTFRNHTLSKDLLRKTYPDLSDELFETKFENSLERPLLFYRSYVNSYYADTQISGPLKKVVFCYGDPHPENFGFISFKNNSEYVFNDIDDSGLCPLGLDILRYFAALRFVVDDEEKIQHLAQVFAATASGKKLVPFDFKRPDLRKKNIKNIKKYTENNKFLPDSKIDLLHKDEKTRIIKALGNQLGELKVLDIASYQKDDGGSAGLKRYWLLVKTKNDHKELIEFKQVTRPGVSWTGVLENIPRTETPQQVWGQYPDYYGYIMLDNQLYMTRTRADDYIDLGKLSEKKQLLLLSYQVQLMALFHQKNLKELGGITSQWIVEGSQRITQRYQEAFEGSLFPTRR